MFPDERTEEMTPSTVELSCTTCGRSTHAPYQHYSLDGALLEACCDRCHERYLSHLGWEYVERFRAFWNLDDTDAAEAWRPARPSERCAVCGGLNPGDVTHTRC